MSRYGYRYCDLRTMDDVQKARKNIHRIMTANEDYLVEDWEDLKERLSPGNILNGIWDRALCSSSFLQKIVAGVRAGASMRERRRSKRSGGCGCE